MVANVFRKSHRCPRLRAAARFTLAIGLLSAAGTGLAGAYVGASFLEVPGLASGWQGPPYKHWLRVDANYWQTDEVGTFARRNFRRNRMFFSAPAAPRKGASALIISIDKHNPALRQLMGKCAGKVRIPALTYAESSVMSRGLTELGSRPADLPEYYEYKLKDVVFSDCPVVPDAPEQALVVSFNDIEWVNYHGDDEGKAFMLEPAVLKPVRYSGVTKSYVVSWFAFAQDVSSDQCTKLNEKAPQEDYYAFMTAAEAEKEKAALASKGGPNYESGQMGLRGPGKLNACALPGIVRDPGLISPQPTVARGLNLDGDDGKGDPPPGIRKHVNYVSEDGRTGIDNQLYTVEGCMPGFQGHRGFLMQYTNEQRRNGLLSILLQVSGIDNELNDDSVDVTVLYSKDPMAKSASGTQILPDYTFRLTDNPEFAHYATRLHGRIVNGVVITEPVKQFQMHLGIDVELTLFDAGMRLQFMPDGTLQGVLGGYQDWRRIMRINANSNAELHYGFQCPGMYNAFKRLADGLKDPVTGEYNGVSSAYDIEGVPAYIPPKQFEALVTQADANGRGAQ
jgi:hypothetical protein